MTTFFPQETRSDKIHHQKIQKISYPMVYLVKLWEFIPGSANLGLHSTGLNIGKQTVLHESYRRVATGF